MLTREVRDRRVETCKKLMSMVIGKDLAVATGYYITIDRDWLQQLQPGRDEDIELKEKLPELKSRCSVCALGGIFMAYVAVFDRVKVGRIIDIGPYGNLLYGPIRGTIEYELSDTFDQQTLDRIEILFEYRQCGAYVRLHHKEEESDRLVIAMAEQLREYDNKRRLLSILQHLIDNDGELVLDLDAMSKAITKVDEPGVIDEA